MNQDQYKQQQDQFNQLKQNNTFQNKKTLFEQNQDQFNGQFYPESFYVPQDASNTIYVQGVPLDATYREVCHVFRPFPGLIEVRLVKRPNELHHLVFVDFEDPLQASICMQTLQDYRFDENDQKGLKIVFANESKDQRKFRLQ